MTEPLNIHEIFRATEADFGDDGNDWITIIREGESINGRNYQKAALKQAVLDRRYEGQRMFVDHSDGPPLKRSVKELVSGITETKYDTSNPDGKARVRGKVKFFNNEFREFANAAKEHIGVSHDARLAGTRSRSTGKVKEDISEIVKVHSVDWVVYPSAGGGIESFYATEGIEPMEAIDWDSVTPEMIEESAPALATKLKEKYTPRVKEEQDPPEEPDEKKEPEAAKALDEKAVEAIVTRAMESVNTKRTAQAGVREKIAALVKKTPLPERTKNRLIAQFDGAEEFEEDKVTEAIKDAKLELKEAGAGPKVTGMGPSRQAGENGKSQPLGRAHEAVAAAFSYKKTPSIATKDRANKGAKEEEAE